MSHKLVGTDEVPDAPLSDMRAIGGTWAAYQNADLSSANFSHIQFLKYGPGCTFMEPPKPRLPDFPNRINWRYQFVGLVDLEEGKINETS